MWRRWGTPQNFCLAFIDELEKQIFIKKNCWGGLIKNVRILIFKMFFIFFFNKETHLDIIILHLYYYFKSWWHDLQFLRYRVWRTETGNYGSFFAFLHPMEWGRLNFYHFGPFSPFYPPSLTTQKIKILKKWKKGSRDAIIQYTWCVPKIMIIWGMLPEIWSVTDIIFCHFGPFFALLSH